MKKVISVFIVTLFLIFAVLPAYALGVKQTIEGVTFYLDESYGIYTEKDLQPGSSVEGLIFFALSPDQKHRIQALSAVTNFSEQLGSFSGLDDELIAPVGDQIFKDGYETVRIASVIYLKSIITDNDGYSAVYVTVSGGKLYTFTYFGSDPTRMGEFLSTLTLPKESGGSNMWIYMIIFISLFIIADIIFLIFLGRSFVRDYRRRKMERDRNIVSQYIKIKRRKY